MTSIRFTPINNEAKYEPRNLSDRRNARLDSVRRTRSTQSTREDQTLRVQAPILIIGTADAKLALGDHLEAAGLAAYREIAFAAKGLEIAYLQFAFRKLTLAVCSRIRRDGVVEIEIGLGDPRLPKSAFTADQMRQAEAASRSRLGATRHRRPRGLIDLLRGGAQRASTACNWPTIHKTRRSIALQGNGAVRPRPAPVFDPPITSTPTLIRVALLGVRETNAMAFIGSAVQRGHSVYVYDEKGRQLHVLSVGGSGPDDGLSGYTGSTVSIRRGPCIYTYDERGGRRA